MYKSQAGFSSIFVSGTGYGSSATVYLARCKPLNTQVALKMIDLDSFERDQIDELRVSASFAVFMYAVLTM